MRKGWEKEPIRHGLASQGIETTSKDIKSKYDGTSSQEDDITYIPERGDILKLENVYLYHKGKWRIRRIREDNKFIDLVKLTKSGRLDDRTNPITLLTKEVKSSVGKWLNEDYSGENTEREHNEMELVEKGKRRGD